MSSLHHLTPNCRSCDATFDPSKPYHYGHGAYLGHMLPGWFFVIWGSWWAFSIVLQYARVCGVVYHTCAVVCVFPLQPHAFLTTPCIPHNPMHYIIPPYSQCTAKRRPYVARSWFPWPGKPQWLASVPLEPWCKVVLPFIGINGELWAGHESWRYVLGGLMCVCVCCLHICMCVCVFVYI